MFKGLDVVAVILAAGQGTRIGKRTPKQFMRFGKKELFTYPLATYTQDPYVDKVVLVVPADAQARVSALCKRVPRKEFRKIHIIAGGSVRTRSIQESLQYLLRNKQAADSFLLFQDGARPFVRRHYIHALLNTAHKKNSSIVGVVSADPIVYVEKERIVKMHGRDKRYLVSQTPECYRLGDLVAAHKKSRKKDPRHYWEKTNLEIMTEAGIKVPMILNLGFNPKLAYPYDVPIFRKLL